MMDGIQAVSGGTWPSGQTLPRQDSPNASETASPRDSYTQSPRQEGLEELMREAREKIDSHRKSLEKMKKQSNPVRYGDAPMTAYARLAGAKTKSQVNAAAGYARRRIAQFRAALRQDGDNAPAIKSAIRQLEKAVSRAEKKKRELNREELLERRADRSRERREEERAQRLCQELRRRRTQRALREKGYLREAEIADRLAGQLTETRMELREQAASLGVGVSAEAAAGQYQAAAETATAVPDTPAADVTV